MAECSHWPAPVGSTGKDWEAELSQPCRYHFTAWGTQFDFPYLNLHAVCIQSCLDAEITLMTSHMLDSTELEALRKHFRYLLQAP